VCDLLKEGGQQKESPHHKAELKLPVEAKKE
jgi:hypothetical protein